MISEEGYKNIIKTYEAETDELYEEIAKLKSTLEEIREYIKEALELKEEYPDEVECLASDLLYIIDKGE